MITLDVKLLKMVEDDCRKIARLLHNRYYWFNMTEEEILEVVYSVVIGLLVKYRPLPDGVGLAPRSYYNRYARNKALEKMFTDYHHREREVSFDGLLTEISGDDEKPDGAYGKKSNGAFSNFDFERSALIRTIENRERVRVVMRRANRLDRKIMKMVMEGYTHSEIARRFRLSRRSISKRLKKYRRFI